METIRSRLRGLFFYDLPGDWGQYRELFDNANDIVYTHDLSGRFTSLNRVCERVVGYTRAEAQDITIFHVVAPEYHARIRAMIDRKRTETDLTRYEVLLIAKDGSQIPVEVNSRLIFENGQPVAVQGIARDISEHKRAEHELQRLATVIEQVGESIILTDTYGIIEYVNPAFEQVSGYRREEVIGKSTRLLKSGEQPSDFYEGLWDTLQRGDVWKGHFTNRKKDGSLYELDATISPLRGAGGKVVGYVAVQRDVTRQTQVEAQLRQSQKMEAIGTLAGGIAHDFNNILAAMIGYTELAMEDLPEGSDAGSDLAHVVQAGRRARDLVQQILMFSRQTEQRPEPIRIDPIVKEALKLLRASLPSTIETVANIDPACGTVLGDPIQIHQVIMNLCTNAFHAMRNKGGVLTVSLSRTTLDDTVRKVYPDLPRGAYLRLSVADTGHGMSRQTMEHIFEPFFSTKEKNEGSGLGLAVVHGIIRSHGGAITVSSELGQGAVFHVYLPSLDRQQAEPPSELPPIPQGNQEHILLVDDEETLVKMGKDMLQRFGYVVSGHLHSTEALEAFRAAPGQYDLVITDQTMPKMTGLQLVKELRRIRPDIPIIIVSGYSEAFREDEKIEGVSEIIMKPTNSRGMAEAIRRALDRSGRETLNGPADKRT